MIDFKKLTKINSRTWVFIICVPMIIAIFILANPPEGSVTEVPKTNDTQTLTPISKKIDVNNIGDEIELHTQAQQFVLQTLKAPSTAKFPALPSQVVDLGDGQYKIVSYVDSQNSFSAMLRSDWSVVMKLNMNVWIPEQIVVGGDVVYDQAHAKKTNSKQ